MWEEFLTEVKGILGLPEEPRIAEKRGEAKACLIIDKSIGLLDCMILTSTSEDTKLENCLNVAANAFRLYKHYKSTA